MENRLHFNSGEFNVKFLGEGEIKKNAFEAQKELDLQRQRSHTSEAGSN